MVPRQVPVQFVMEHEEKIYLAVPCRADDIRRMLANPAVAIAARVYGKTFLTLSGTLVFDDSAGLLEKAGKDFAKAALDWPALEVIVSPGHRRLPLFHLKDASGELTLFDGERTAVSLAPLNSLDEEEWD